MSNFAATDHVAGLTADSVIFLSTSQHDTVAIDT